MMQSFSCQAETTIIFIVDRTSAVLPQTVIITHAVLSVARQKHAVLLVGQFTDVFPARSDAALFRAACSVIYPR